MNKKVWVMMLILTISALAVMYILKIFFPNEFVLAITSERAIAIGAYIDSHLWLYYICCGITAFITYYLYCCACTRKWYLNWKECLIILATIVIIRLTGIYIDPTLRTAISISSFVWLPAIMRGDLRTTAIVYTTHLIAQALVLGIRDLPIYLTNVNFISTLLVGLESYFWLLLFYFIFNYKSKKETN